MTCREAHDNTRPTPRHVARLSHERPVKIPQPGIAHSAACTASHLNDTTHERRPSEDGCLGASQVRLQSSQHHAQRVVLTSQDAQGQSSGTLVEVISGSCSNQTQETDARSRTHDETRSHRSAQRSTRPRGCGRRRHERTTHQAQRLDCVGRSGLRVCVVAKQACIGVICCVCEVLGRTMG